MLSSIGVSASGVVDRMQGVRLSFKDLDRTVKRPLALASGWLSGRTLHRCRRRRVLRTTQRSLDGRLQHKSSSHVSAQSRPCRHSVPHALVANGIKIGAAAARHLQERTMTVAMIAGLLTRRTRHRGSLTPADRTTADRSSRAQRGIFAVWAGSSDRPKSPLSSTAPKPGAIAVVRY